MGREVIFGSRWDHQVARKYVKDIEDVFDDWAKFFRHETFGRGVTDTVERFLSWLVLGSEQWQRLEPQLRLNCLREELNDGYKTRPERPRRKRR